MVEFDDIGVKSINYDTDYCGCYIRQFTCYCVSDASEKITVIEHFQYLYHKTFNDKAWCLVWYITMDRLRNFSLVKYN